MSKKAIKSFKSIKVLIDCRLEHGNIQKDTDTEKLIYYDFIKFGDFQYSSQPHETVNTLH